MSSLTGPAATGTAFLGIDWTKINWAAVGTDFAAIAAVVAPLLPGASTVLMVAKIIQGVLDGVPEAIALVKQIKSGTPPTAAELSEFQTAYEAAYQKLNADIAAQLAKLPA